MYPTLLVALIGAVPQYKTWVDAWRLGISPSKVPALDEKARLYEKNEQCLKNPLPQVVATKFNIEVSVTACPSGDVLVSTRKPGTDPRHQWVTIATP